jgi:hypothetical protein
LHDSFTKSQSIIWPSIPPVRSILVLARRLRSA